MNTIALLFFAALAVPAQPDWLTISGDVGDANSDYFQFKPGSVRAERNLRFVDLRASQAQPQSTDGLIFRSFDASAVVDCEKGTARYISTRYFEKPNFEGAPEKVQTHVGVKPVVCWMMPDGSPRLLIRAACAIGTVSTAEG